jgi:hypothetical protein
MAASRISRWRLSELRSVSSDGFIAVMTPKVLDGLVPEEYYTV